jgi:ArsR family transcriptional regulator
MRPQTFFDDQARLCKAMGYPIRLEILHTLRDGPKSAHELSEILKTLQPTISRHLASLRSAGIVVPDHQGHNIYYGVANPKLLDVCELMRQVSEEKSIHNMKLAREM